MPSCLPRASRRATNSMLLAVGILYASSFLGGETAAATYYVRVTGNDTNTGTAAAAAFLTIEKAAEIAASGDTVYVGAGTYGIDVKIRDIAGAAPLQFIADTDGAHTGDAGAVVVGYDRQFFVRDSDQVQLRGFTFAGNSHESIAWIDSTNGLIEDCVVNGGVVGIAVAGGDVVLDGVQIQNCTDKGVDVSKGTATIQGASISSNGTGVEVSYANLKLSSTTLSYNSLGLFSLDADSVNVSSTSIINSSGWGVACYASASPSAAITLSNSLVANNAGGIVVIDAEDGDFSLTSSTVVRDNSQAGIRFDSCNLTVNDQAQGANWSTLRNGTGISCVNSTVTLIDVLVSDSGSYGIHCDSSTVTVSACTVTGVAGIYAGINNNSLVVSRSRFDATASGSWGLVRQGGNLNVANSVFYGFQSGVYLATSNSLNRVSIANSTVANASVNGIYQYSGSATVRNTIILGSSGQYGLRRISGTLNHSHNLLFGFTTTYSGTGSGIGEIVKNPRLVDAANGDLQLASGSPAINTGVAIADIASDLDGNTRPLFGAFDMGAYEYTSDSGSFRVLRWGRNRLTSAGCSSQPLQLAHSSAGDPLGHEDVPLLIEAGIMRVNELAVPPQGWVFANREFAIALDPRHIST